MPPRSMPGKVDRYHTKNCRERRLIRLTFRGNFGPQTAFRAECGRRNAYPTYPLCQVCPENLPKKSAQARRLDKSPYFSKGRIPKGR